MTGNGGSERTPRRLHKAFLAQVARTPGAVALSGHAGPITYRDLRARAEELAAHLRAAGVRPGDPVGVLLPRSADAVTAILAVLLAGGMYVPLDLAVPDDRLTFMLSDAGVQRVITRRAHAARLRAEFATVMLDELPPAPGGAPPSSVVTGPDLACINYTSGSTGRPKGVPIGHAGILNLVFGQTYCPFGPGEVHLLLSSLSFDFSTLELWGALLTGARLALYEEPFVTLDALGRVLRAERVTTLMLTPSLFTLMVSERLEDLRGVRQVLLGGDVPSVKAARAFLRAAPGASITNVYGPTENTVFTTCFTLRDPNFPPGPIPIGHVIPGTQALLLDEGGQDVPDGEVGEVWLGGVGLTPGYLNRPDLNAERFARHPRARTPDGRLYRSGDLARRRADGALEFVGRADLQVKIRGYRIEPGEIEAVLREHPSVREAAVVARPARVEGQDKRLVAYCEAAGARALDTGALREHLARTLPPYMLPTAIIEVAALPLTTSGKLDRLKLAALELPPVDAGPQRVTAPLPDDLSDMTALWEELLGTRVGPDDDFFALGGTSLQAALLLARLSQRFGTEVHPGAFFAGATPRGLSARLAERAPTGPEGVVPLRPGRADHTLFFAGDPFLYRLLAPHLRTDGAVSALHVPLGPIEEMAARAVADLRRVQRRGPYHLAGFSFDGLVAYEMACQLADLGERTVYLALLDTGTPHMEAMRVLSNPGFWSRLVGHARYARRLPVRRGVRYLWQRARLAARVRANRQERNPHHDTLLQLVRPHVIRPSALTVTLFRAQHEDTHLIDPLLGWEAAAARVEVRDVPGLHMDLVRSPAGVQRVAALMSADLAALIYDERVAR